MHKIVRAIRIAVLVVASVLVLIAIYSMFFAVVFTPVSRTTPPSHLFLMAGEGRIGYVTETDPKATPPILPNDSDNFTRAMSRQFEFQELNNLDRTRDPGDLPNWTRSTRYGFVVDHAVLYGREISFRDPRTGKDVRITLPSYSRYEYQIPAWCLCLPAISWGIGKLLFIIVRKIHAQRTVSRGFEVEPPRESSSV